MAKKVAVPSERAPDLGFMINRGIKLSDFSELFMLAGLGDHGSDGAIRHPGDAVKQAESIFAELKG